MRTIFAATFMLVAAALAGGLSGSAPAFAQTAPSPAVLKDLAPTGKLRAAINFGNPVLAQRGPNGEPQGVSAELAAALAKRLGVPLDYVRFEAAHKVFEALAAGSVDVGFIAIDPKRAAEVEFTPPYVLIEGTYMVRQDSPLKDVGDVDKPGIKIGIGLGSVYDLYLTRTLKHATLVRSDNGVAAFVRDNLDAAGGIKQPLAAYAAAHPGLRMLDGRFMLIRQALGLPKGRGEAVGAFVRAFIAEMKESGFVADALKRSGQGAELVAAD